MVPEKLQRGLLKRQRLPAFEKPEEDRSRFRDAGELKYLKRFGAL